MAITKPKKKDTTTATQDVDDFIAGAPDSKTSVKGVRKGNKQQISLTITPDLLEKVDALASKMGQSRAAVINMAIYQAVED
ncbi:MAG: ribbon-helix-helix domain-containing protein [Leucothrix sp.]|jgi:predicted DNA binding CopG/RHH family protein|uniref:ribbon-helix-helix domain-containing protein n=1 Tax=uncultured Paraglaciecola sp. TaxID=1765024 RepID=UPI002603C656|nr:ribbon-helix-helix domain-containing protein [uncultured Paraglaciecola sp.]